jgi:hypothetical protein
MSKTNKSTKSTKSNKSNKPTNSINKYKIIKELGHGMVGTTYLVKLGNKKYALKIEKISEKNLKTNTKFSEWREIEFSEKFGNFHPDQFIQLIKYDIVDNCEHNQVYPGDLKYLPENVSNYLIEKNKSKYCIRKVYSLVDCDLSKIIVQLDKKQIYSLIVQNAYIIYLLESNGYSHNDLHSQNIGVIKTKKKYIKILGSNVPTLGFQYVGLDFGKITWNKWELTEEEIKDLNPNKDIMRIIKRFIKYSGDLEIDNGLGEKRKISKLIELGEIKNYFDLIKDTEEYDTLSKFVETDKDKIILFQILYPKKFQQIILGKEKIQVVNLLYKLDLIDILYFFKYKNDLKKIIKYFTLKLDDRI